MRRIITEPILTEPLVVESPRKHTHKWPGYIVFDVKQQCLVKFCQAFSTVEDN